jgi:protein SCO1/2
VSAIYQTVRKATRPETLQVYGAVTPFSLQSAWGGMVSNETLAGNPYIIDFIFTRCAGQCPIMTHRMKSVQDWLTVDGLDKVKLVSVSVDSDYDTTTVMAQFAQKFEADSDRWQFLTGDRDEIYKLIREGFKLGVDDEPVSGTFSPEEPIIHSNRFVLVDAKGNIRGYYTGLDPDDLVRLRSELPLVINEQSFTEKR